METWKQPPVRPGMVVEYRRAHAYGSIPMMVTNVSDTFVTGCAWTLRGSVVPIPTAYHISNPELEKRPVLLEEGTWDYNQDTKELHKLRDEVARLRDLVEGRIFSMPAAPAHEEHEPEQSREELLAKAAELWKAGMDKPSIVRETGLHHKQVDKAIRMAGVTI